LYYYYENVTLIPSCHDDITICSMPLLAEKNYNGIARSIIAQFIKEAC